MSFVLTSEHCPSGEGNSKHWPGNITFWTSSFLWSIFFSWLVITKRNHYLHIPRMLLAMLWCMLFFPFPPIDSIWGIMTVWRIMREKYQHCSMLCYVQWLCTVYSYTYKQFLKLCVPYFPQIDIIRAMVIVWRVRGIIIRSVLCSIVCNNCAQCNAHTYVWTDLTVLWKLFCLTGPISLCLDHFLYVLFFVSLYIACMCRIVTWWG